MCFLSAVLTKCFVSGNTKMFYIQPSFFLLFSTPCCQLCWFWIFCSTSPLFFVAIRFIVSYSQPSQHYCSFFAIIKILSTYCACWTTSLEEKFTLCCTVNIDILKVTTVRRCSDTVGHIWVHLFLYYGWLPSMVPTTDTHAWSCLKLTFHCNSACFTI